VITGGAEPLGKIPRDCLTMLAKDIGQQTEPMHLYNLRFMAECEIVKPEFGHFA
jgi:hypothetical protein